MTEPTVARRVERVLGMWSVIHPFTGRVEFNCAHRELADAVRDEFDRRDPIGIKWLYEELDRIPPHARQFAEWVMPRTALNTIRQAATTFDRGPLWIPSFTSDGPDYLLGKPVVVDNEAAGISLREAAA